MLQSVHRVQQPATPSHQMIYPRYGKLRRAIERRARALGAWRGLAWYSEHCGIDSGGRLLYTNRETIRRSLPIRTHTEGPLCVCKVRHPPCDALDRLYGEADETTRLGPRRQSPPSGSDSERDTERGPPARDRDMNASKRPPGTGENVYRCSTSCNPKCNTNEPQHATARRTH